MAQKLNDAAVAVLAGARRPMTATSIVRWLIAGGQFVGESETDLAVLIRAGLSNRDDVVAESADGATEFILRSVRDAEVRGNHAQSMGQSVGFLASRSVFRPSPYARLRTAAVDSGVK